MAPLPKLIKKSKELQTAVDKLVTPTTMAGKMHAIFESPLIKACIN